MGKTKTNRSAKKSQTAESEAKKRLVENLAAELHELPGVKVERNKWLPSLINPEDEREIDVLLTVNPVGYEMRIAVECKNLARPIEAKDIGEFADKLRQVGIQTQGSIYVSASKYRRGAKTRAQELGIVLLRPLGLTPNRLSLIVQEAFQSIVFLLAIIAGWTVRTEVPGQVFRQPTLEEQNLIFDENGRVFGLMPDLIWESWRYEGAPPSVIGEHEVELNIPAGWHQIICGQRVPILKASATVAVLGLVVSISGTFEHVSLLDAVSEHWVKTRIRAIFDTAKEHKVTTFSSEEDFQSFMDRPRLLHIVSSRIRLPRVVAQLGYWPPSKKTALKVMSLMAAFERGEIPDPRPFDYVEVEGTDLSALWDEIVDGSPVVERNAGRRPFEG
jgi:Restriction endonuclease